MHNIGIIDMGSNSVRLVIVSTNEKGCFKVIHETKASLRLGEHLVESSFISEEKINETIKTLKKFKHISEIYGVNYIKATATEAVRKASNREDFLSLIKENTGIVIELISGEQEAYYDYLAVVNSLKVNNALIIDIGGSSTELIHMENRALKNSISLPFGSLNISKKFNLKDEINSKKELEVKEYILNKVINIPWLTKISTLPIIGVGGSFRNLGKIHRKDTNYPLDLSVGYEIEIVDFKKLFNRFKELSFESKKKVKGLSEDRADIFTGALCIMNFFCEYTNATKLKISGSGIREGLIYSYLFDNFKYKGVNSKVVSDIMDFSINNYIEINNINKNHSERAFKITSMLLKALFEPDSYNFLDLKSIIKCASLLHDSGVNINYYDHHKHSFYMILNSNINGISPKELLMAAFVAASHRKNEYKIDLNLYGNILKEEDVEIISKLSSILKLGEWICSSAFQPIKSINCVNFNEYILMKIIDENNEEIKLEFADNILLQFKNSFGKNITL